MRSFRAFLPFLILFGFARAASAADDQASKYDDMSIEDLMNVKVSVASSKPTTINRSPGIVTLITSEDISHMGARDIEDVLMTVPGFSIGMDSFSATGEGFRGLWGHLGKILYLIDNQVVNDGLFQTMPLGRRFPIAMIDRIEIIRGPGSVRYGRNAELAVVKITTKLGAKATPAISVMGGTQQGGSAEKSIEGVYSYKSDLVDAGALASYKGASQGEGTVTDNNGNVGDFKGRSHINDSFGEGAVRIGKLSSQVMYDEYIQQDISNFGYNIATPARNQFHSLLARSVYDEDIGDKMKIHPYVEYRHDRPWQFTDPDGVAATGGVTLNRTVDHYEAGVNATYDVSENLEFLFGVLDYEEDGQDNTNIPFRHDNSLKVKISGAAVFAEARYDMKWAELTAGIRYEANASYGGAVAPRIGLVKEYETWGYKALLSQGYTPPGVEEVEDQTPGHKIKAETSTVAELELNKKLTSKSILGLNLFSVTIKDPIVYEYIGGFNTYENFDRVGSNGFELTYQYRDSINSLKASYSYSQPDARVAYWSVPDHNREFTGLENQKATLLDTLRFGDGYFVTPSINWIAPRYGQQYSVAAATMTLQRFEAITYVNLVAEKRDFLTRGLTISLGVYNLLGQDYRVLQANNAGNGSIPSPSREYLMRLTHTF